MVVTAVSVTCLICGYLVMGGLAQYPVPGFEWKMCSNTQSMLQTDFQELHTVLPTGRQAQHLHSQRAPASREQLFLQPLCWLGSVGWQHWAPGASGVPHGLCLHVDPAQSPCLCQSSDTEAAVSQSTTQNWLLPQRDVGCIMLQYTSVYVLFLQCV